MKAIIVQFTFGLVAFNEKCQLNEIFLFEKNPKLVAKNFKNYEDGILFLQLRSFINTLLNKDFTDFSFENNEIAKTVETAFNVRIGIIRSSTLKKLRMKMKLIAIKTGFIGNLEELLEWNRTVGIELTKLKITGASEKRDLIISQAIQTLDDLDRTVNLFMSHIREWYGVHFPEIDRLVEKHETYAHLVVNLGNRENFSISNLKNESMQDKDATKLSKAAVNSVGARMAENDLSQIRNLSRKILGFYELRKGMEKYIDINMKEIAPNTRTIAGSLLGARLISVAGSLQNLAMKPASTIQVLGAEKALFRSLKTGAKPPKHGLIFQHPLLHDAKRWQRGKIARILAGKIAIAARIDAFNGKYVGDLLKKEVDKRIAEIKKKYKDPPLNKEKYAKPGGKKSRYKKKGRIRVKKKHRKNKSAIKG